MVAKSNIIGIGNFRFFFFLLAFFFLSYSFLSFPSIIVFLFFFFFHGCPWFLFISLLSTPFLSFPFLFSRFFLSFPFYFPFLISFRFLLNSVKDLVTAVRFMIHRFIVSSLSFSFFSLPFHFLNFLSFSTPSIFPFSLLWLVKIEHFEHKQYLIKHYKKYPKVSWRCLNTKSYSRL